MATLAPKALDSHKESAARWWSVRVSRISMDLKLFDLARRLAALPENDHPAQVIVAILTDGMENGSEKFTWEQVAKLITDQTEKHRWTFLFLGANQDALATARRLNIPTANAATYESDDAGSRASHASVSRKVRGLRVASMGSATAQETFDASATMSEIVQEEDRKERS